MKKFSQSAATARHFRVLLDSPHPKVWHVLRVSAAQLLTFQPDALPVPSSGGRFPRLEQQFKLFIRSMLTLSGATLSAKREAGEIGGQIRAHFNRRALLHACALATLQ